MPPITDARAPGLTIGELSRQTGVNVETIRYYERVQMLPAPPRTAAGVAPTIRHTGAHWDLSGGRGI